MDGLLKEVLFLDSGDQVRLMRVWVREIKGNRSLLQKIYFLVTRAYYPLTELEDWIESRLEKDMTFTPTRLAYECGYYKRIKREMVPHLLLLARRVKDRMRKRMVK